MLGSINEISRHRLLWVVTSNLPPFPVREISLDHSYIYCLLQCMIRYHRFEATRARAKNSFHRILDVYKFPTQGPKSLINVLKCNINGNMDATVTKCVTKWQNKNTNRNLDFSRGGKFNFGICWDHGGHHA